MADDNGSPPPGASFPSPKREKTSPRALHDEASTLDELNQRLRRRSTSLRLENGSQPPEESELVEASQSPSNETLGLPPQSVRGSVNGDSMNSAPKPKSSSLGGLVEAQGSSALTVDNTVLDKERLLMQASRPLTSVSPGGLSLAEDTKQHLEEDFGSFPPRFPSPEVDLRNELGPWSPPPEPFRPPNPYIPGQNLEIRRHKAAPPFGDEYPDYPGIRDYTSEIDLRTKTLVEICLEHPPMEGETVWEDPPRNLHIIDQIRARDDSGAQVVVCRLDNEPNEYAAKIYDPLYYGFNDRLWPGDPRDTPDEADKDYCREVAAYLEINDQFGGKEIPKYYGSWTFQLSLDLADSREVRDIRLILLERIKGGTMSEKDPRLYPEQVRLEALAQIMKTFSLITFAGVRHRDLAQRNVMFCDGDTAETIDRVVLLDFNFAVVSRLDDFELLYGSRSEKASKPYNPIDDWWETGGLYFKFGHWFPESWQGERRPVREWLYELWGKSQEFLPHKTPLDWTDY